MRSLFRLNSLALLALGIGCFVMSVQLPLGTFAAPGAGAWPMFLSLCLSAGAVFLLVAERDGEDYERLTRKSLISVLGFIWIGAYVVMFATIGFSLASLIFSIVWLRFLAQESWRFSLTVGPAFAVAMVLIFVVGLRVPVPHDPVMSLITGGRF
ncbi:tripartite tricarboxylate transporter TctB family protein [Salinibacterium sp. ZJ70]|uniref:tripartite tricarboxylate transporter TctB family protein n=1 Tax=Salinibacterium sp. ZJ70 TaxID=2708084 RepID=UPI00141F56A0|nr:tripartite tricarboxylate transporter TctB family protein [Salinibacterium sp. ZJ70]